MKKPAARVDHLVVAAESLDQGVQWCEAMLGITPQAGGEQPHVVLRRQGRGDA